MKKLLTLATTLTLLLALSVPVLADDATSNASSTQASTGQSAPTAKAVKNNQQEYMGPVRDLQKQEKQIREQIHSTRSQVHQQLKTVKKAKNYTVLATALSDMTAIEDDIIGVSNATKTCLTDWQQYYTDRQAKNASGITADLQKIQTDIAAKISAMQKILIDLQKVSDDLNMPSSTPTSTSSTT